MRPPGKPAIVAGFVALYVALDWVSLIEPFGPLGIAPWNPATGIGFAFLLHFGPWLAPALCAALLIADLLFRELTASPVAMTLSAVANVALYTAAAVLLRQRISLDLDSRRDLLLLLAAAAITATLAAAAVIGSFAAGGLLSPDAVPDAVLHFWVGDVIGIAVLTPFVLVLLHHPSRLRATAETALQLAAVLFGLWVIFGFESQNHFEFSYILFIPLIWIAMRDGLAGSVWGVLATQIGLMAALQIKGLEADAMTQFQILMLAVAVTGLLLGSAVDERKRAEARLKEHEADLAHAMRLAATGETAAAIAHELNQPLTAAISFARACQAVLEAESRENTEARGLLDQTVAQALRAGEIIRRTREFLTHGEMRLIRVDLAQVIASASELMRARAARHAVTLVTRLAPGLPPVLADPLQIEQVLLNLIRNSIDAIARAGSSGEITIAATAADQSGYIKVRVSDTGPGFAPDMAGRLFTALATTKDTGMGLGLSISRSIVEAHGGRIWAEPADGHGADICLTLPIYTRDD